MATVVVRADPPLEGIALATLASETPLSEADAARLYRSALGDVVSVVEASDPDLLVTYRQVDGVDAESVVCDALTEALDTDPRLEVQVGSRPAARIGNTVTHLLEEEGETSVAILDPTAVLVTPRVIDQAAMKLRRNPVVLGPSADGALFYAGFTDTMDFTDVDRPPIVEAFTDAAVAAELGVDFLSMQPTLSTGAQLRSALPILTARQRAGLAIPERTVGVIEDLGLQSEATDEFGLGMR